MVCVRTIARWELAVVRLLLELGPWRPLFFAYFLRASKLLAATPDLQQVPLNSPIHQFTRVFSVCKFHHARTVNSGMLFRKYASSQGPTVVLWRLSRHHSGVHFLLLLLILPPWPGGVPRNLANFVDTNQGLVSHVSMR